MNNSFGERLANLLKIKKMNQTVFANNIGIDHSLISRYINDKKKPSVENLIKISRELNVSPDYLLDYMYDNSTPETAFEMVKYYLSKNVDIWNKEQKEELIKVLLSLKNRDKNQ